MEQEDISETIKELILEEKRKNFISKTEQFYEPANFRRCHSASLIHYKKEKLSLPFHLERMLHSNRKCPNIATDDLLDSIYGAFFGFLIGDIVGAHVAFKIYNLHEIPSALLMNGGGTYNLGPGQGTDQTEMLFSTAYGLIDGGSVYNPDLMAKRYLNWLESKPFNVSAIFILSLVEIRRKKYLEKGISLEGLGETLKKNSEKNRNHESNLGLVRVLPLVIWSLNLSEREFHKLIRDELSLICPNELVI